MIFGPEFLFVIVKSQAKGLTHAEISSGSKNSVVMADFLEELAPAGVYFGIHALCKNQGSYI